MKKYYFYLLFFSIFSCFLLSCQKGETVLETALQTESHEATPIESPYVISLSEGSKLAELKSTLLNITDKGIEYELEVIPKVGYTVDAVSLNGEEKEISDNKIRVILNGDASVEVESSRKKSDELEKRRSTVVDKMFSYTTTRFRYDKDYKYILNDKEITLSRDVLYGGLPYTAYSAISPDAFLDFAVSRDEDGTYLLSFPYGDDPFYWGGSCGNAVFWSWASVSSSIKFSYSANMIEENGAIPVGTWTYTTDDISNGIWSDTQKTCKQNGSDVLFESYALMAEGDALTYISPKGNHVMLVREVNIERSLSGRILGNKSYVTCMDQNGGFSYKDGADGVKYCSSCSVNSIISFESLFNEGYLPVTCIELLDDNVPLAEVVFKDSNQNDDFGYIDVTRGYFDSNYAISKVEMTVTDSAGNVVYEGVRHTVENNPLRFGFSKFSTNDAEFLEDIYREKFDAYSLEKGNYRVIVKAFFSNGSSMIVRDKTFTR